MKEYTKILDVFSREGYEMYSRTIPASEWGKRDIAETYLERYWLSATEYASTWKQVQDRVFINQKVGLPEMVFSPEYELHVSGGGCLFIQEEFVKIQQCAQGIAEKFLFVLENTFGGRVKEPIFRMKFPISISWDELAGGNFASSILLEMPHKDYFVFGDSGTWGKYVANDYKSPIDIFGFKPEIASVFQRKLNFSEAEERELANALPIAYRSRVPCKCYGQN